MIKSKSRRRPQHDYPVLVAIFRPKAHTRIQKLDDGSVETLLTYQEHAELAAAANQVAMETGKGALFEILQRLPPKDPMRKKMWDRINAAHHWRRRQRNHGHRC